MDMDERRDLVGRLFAVLTAELEDAAASAAEGQSLRLSLEEAAALAGRVGGAASKAAIIAEAAGALITSTSDE